jgi:ribosomal protein L29
MAKHISTTGELRALSAADLRKEILELAGEVAKQRLAIQAHSEKDTASFARNKKQLARMHTVLRQIEGSKVLNTKAKTSKIPAPATSA